MTGNHEGQAARRARGPAGAPGGASPQARRLAAVILEVLAGLRGPGEAAEAVGMSLPRYYAAEARALRGLVGGCEPAARGRPAGAHDLQALRQECGRLRRQCDRQQALLRLQQRALGLGAAPAPGRGEEGWQEAAPAAQPVAAADRADAPGTGQRRGGRRRAGGGLSADRSAGAQRPRRARRPPAAAGREQPP